MNVIVDKYKKIKNIKIKNFDYCDPCQNRAYKNLQGMHLLLIDKKNNFDGSSFINELCNYYSNIKQKLNELNSSIAQYNSEKVVGNPIEMEITQFSIKKQAGFVNYEGLEQLINNLEKYIEKTKKYVDESKEYKNAGIQKIKSNLDQLYDCVKLSKHVDVSKNSLIQSVKYNQGQKFVFFTEEYKQKLMMLAQENVITDELKATNIIEFDFKPYYEGLPENARIAKSFFKSTYYKQDKFCYAICSQNDLDIKTSDEIYDVYLLSYHYLFPLLLVANNSSIDSKELKTVFLETEIKTRSKSNIYFDLLDPQTTTELEKNLETNGLKYNQDKEEVFKTFSGLIMDHMENYYNPVFYSYHKELFKYLYDIRDEDIKWHYGLQQWIVIVNNAIQQMVNDPIRRKIFYTEAAASHFKSKLLKHSQAEYGSYTIKSVEKALKIISPYTKRSRLARKIVIFTESINFPTYAFTSDNNELAFFESCDGIKIEALDSNIYQTIDKKTKDLEESLTLIETQKEKLMTVIEDITLKLYDDDQKIDNIIPINGLTVPNFEDEDPDDEEAKFFLNDDQSKNLYEEYISKFCRVDKWKDHFSLSFYIIDTFVPKDSHPKLTNGLKLLAAGGFYYDNLSKSGIDLYQNVYKPVYCVLNYSLPFYIAFRWRYFWGRIVEVFSNKITSSAKASLFLQAEMATILYPRYVEEFRKNNGLDAIDIKSKISKNFFSRVKVISTNQMNNADVDIRPASLASFYAYGYNPGDTINDTLLSKIETVEMYYNRGGQERDLLIEEMKTLSYNIESMSKNSSNLFQEMVQSFSKNITDMEMSRNDFYKQIPNINENMKKMSNILSQQTNLSQNNIANNAQTNKLLSELVQKQEIIAKIADIQTTYASNEEDMYMAMEDILRNQVSEGKHIIQVDKKYSKDPRFTLFINMLSMIKGQAKTEFAICIEICIKISNNYGKNIEIDKKYFMSDYLKLCQYYLEKVEALLKKGLIGERQTYEHSILKKFNWGEVSLGSSRFIKGQLAKAISGIVSASSGKTVFNFKLAQSSTLISAVNEDMSTALSQISKSQDKFKDYDIAKYFLQLLFNRLIFKKNKGGSEFRDQDDLTSVIKAMAPILFIVEFLIKAIKTESNTSDTTSICLNTSKLEQELKSIILGSTPVALEYVYMDSRDIIQSINKGNFDNMLGDDQKNLIAESYNFKDGKLREEELINVDDYTNLEYGQNEISKIVVNKSNKIEQFNNKTLDQNKFL